MTHTNTHWASNWLSSNREQRNPFVSDSFLTALETTGVCNFASGWQPQHLRIDAHIQVPTYLKTHSWGEYVFDWAWTRAYEQHGLPYYPKLVVAAPYTPSVGPRLLGVQNESEARLVIDALKAKVTTDHLSGFHILFPEAREQIWLDACKLHKRTDVQFHWKNAEYRDFADFLERFSSRKRKNVRKERASITDQGIVMQTLEGANIDERSWQAFYQFYHATYLKRGRQGYLNKAFFDALLATQRHQLVLVMAMKNNQPIASALFFKDDTTLYGRYWGCFDEYNNLHFEACYYQGIEYCIKHQLRRFDPGTQGEHKIARGFEPTFTHSYHWLAHPGFAQALTHFCAEEATHTQAYYNQVQKALPFKQLSTQDEDS